MNSTAFATPSARSTPRQAGTPKHRSGPAPRKGVGDLFLWTACLGFIAILATVVSGETAGSLRAPGGTLIAGARLAGFTGAYLFLLMVVLIARIPWIEGAVGQDRLVRWHRRLAPWGLGLITAHVVLVTLGYAQSARSGALAQLWTFVTTYPDMLAAIAGFSLLLLAGATSIRIARQRMRYETWWIVHLYTYLALALSFTHQIATGRTFVGHPLARALWLSVWVSVAGAVLAFRVLLPLARSLRHRLRVVAVTEETPGVFVVVCRGRRLDRLAVSGGQFFRWRFLNRDLWWHAHPYSLSALPKPPFLRLTVKSSGDQSAAVASITPGTAVMIEGPYGTFTRHAGSRDRVALIAAGVGVTPLRALLEDLPRSVDVVVVLRATRREDLVHRDEMAALVARRGGKLYEVVGPRNTVPLTDKTLGQLIPDLAHRDVYVCGPDGFADVIVDASRRLGVPRRSIHREAFGF